MNHSVSKLPESESSWETSSTSFDLMKFRGVPAAEAAVRAALESPRTSQGSRRAPRRRNPAVDAEVATATRIKRRSRVLLWAEPRPPAAAAAAAADDGGFAMAGRRGRGQWDQIKRSGFGEPDRVRCLVFLQNRWSITALRASTLLRTERTGRPICTWKVRFSPHTFSSSFSFQLSASDSS
jgi:hypothetical protein